MVGVASAAVWTCRILADDAVALAPNVEHPRSLAVSSNGQTVVTIDSRSEAILAGDASRAEPWREVVTAPGPGLPRPVAVGSMPGEVIAALCRDGDDWTLRTYRTEPDTSADSAAPLQVVKIGVGAGEAGHAAVVVNHVRGALIVTGLPEPLPPVIRCAIAGVRLGPSSDRSCPDLPDTHRPIAVAINAAGDMLLVLRPESGDDILAVHDPAGREILWLPTGLHDVTGITISRGDAMLWAVGTASDGRQGLWRLDASFHDRRQVVQPVFIRPLMDPAGIAAVSARDVIVIDEKPKPTLSRIHLRTPAPFNSKETLP